MATENFLQQKNRCFVLSVWNFALLLLIAGAEYFGNPQFWPVALLVFLPQQIFAIPTVALLAFCVWKKRPKVFAFNFIALFFLVFYFLGFNIPISSRTIWPGATLRVMTYNIRYGSRGIEEIVQIIKTENPDIFCLQEVLAKDGWPDPLPFLKKQFPEYSVARYGQLATFSRWPIKRQKSHFLPGREAIGVLETQIIAPEKTLAVFNVHAINPLDNQLATLQSGIERRAQIRGQQFALLNSLAWQQRISFLVAGDFNTPPRKLFRDNFSDLGTDVFKASGWGFGYSFPAFCPALRIDYLWASRDLRPVSSRVIASRASDHRAIVAQLALE